MRTNSVVSPLLGLALTFALAGCGSSDKPQPGGIEKPANAASSTEKSATDTEKKAPPSSPGQSTPEKHEDALRLTAAEVEQAGIIVEAIRPQKMADQLELTANIAANQNRIAHIAPRIEGQLIDVKANLGDRVKAGQALALIDSVQMGEARAEYRRAQSELRLADASFKRIDRLYKEEVVPQRQWLEAKSAYERAQASADASTGKLRMLGGLPDTGASNFVLTAPFSGVVIEKDAVLGELAKPDKSLFTVADLSSVWIEANVAEKDIEKLAVGASAAITVSAFPDEVFKGRVSYLANIVDKQTRTIRARIEIPNREGKLRIDMYAKAAIDHAEAHEALALPQDAVLMIEGRPTVYLATADGFAPRRVELGARLKGHVVIASGLKAGEKVVTAGAYALKARQLKSQIGESH